METLVAAPILQKPEASAGAAISSSAPGPGPTQSLKALEGRLTPNSSTDRMPKGFLSQSHL